MNNIKRYGIDDPMGETCMFECDQGEWRKNEDYQKLEADYEKKNEAYNKAHIQALSNGAQALNAKREVKMLKEAIERLKKILKASAEGMSRIALHMPPVNKWSPQLIQLALAMESEVNKTTEPMDYLENISINENGSLCTRSPEKAPREEDKG